MLKDPSLLPQQQHHQDRMACLQEWMAAAAAGPQQQRSHHKQQHRLHEQQPHHHKHKEQQQPQPSISTADVTSLLQRLQADVVRCVHADSSYSPYCDMAKSLAGAALAHLLCSSQVVFKVKSCQSQKAQAMAELHSLLRLETSWLDQAVHARKLIIACKLSCCISPHV
jgi:hypothetical protein